MSLRFDYVYDLVELVVTIQRRLICATQPDREIRSNGVWMLVQKVIPTIKYSLLLIILSSPGVTYQFLFSEVKMTNPVVKTGLSTGL